LQWAKDIFDSLSEEEFKELAFTKHSNKAKVVIDIVKEAVKLSENVLVFVHSIPTLEYLVAKLRHKKQKVYVLTGSTAMKVRQPLIDKFNKVKGAVFLISCRVTSLCR
jgi:SNF2 family DNA or RNA helicase